MGFMLRKPSKAQHVSSDQDVNKVNMKPNKNGKLNRLTRFLKERAKVFHKKSSKEKGVQSQILNCVDDISYDTINTVFYNTPWDDDMHGPTPVEQRLGIPVSPEYFQTLTQPQLAQDVEDIGDRSYSEPIIDVADSPATQSAEQPSPSESKECLIRSRKNPGPTGRTHSRDVSDVSTLPVSLRTHASDSCLVAKSRVLSQACTSSTRRSTAPQKDPLKSFIDLKLKSEKAWKLLLQTREVVHGNEIAALKDEHADKVKELEEAKVQFEQGLARADRSKTYLQKQLKRIHAAKEDAEKTAKATQDQLAKQQAEPQEVAKSLQEENTKLRAQYQELANDLHWEDVARKAAEENSNDLKAQLGLYREQYLTRDNALTGENRRLLGVVSELQLKNHGLIFEQMRHVSCDTQEQYAQVQEEFALAQAEWKEEQSAAEREANFSRYKIRELQDAVEGTAGEDYIDQANTIQLRTKQVEELLEQVKQLTTEVEKVVKEKVTLEFRTQISTEAVHKEVSRLVASKDTLEKRLATVQKAHGELVAFPRGLLRASQNQLIEAGSKILESLRDEKDILAASLAGTMAARETADQEVLLLRQTRHDLESELKEKTEKVAELEEKLFNAGNPVFQAEVETEMVRYNKDKVIKEKDNIIIGLQNVTQQYLQHITWLGQQGADARSAWLLQFQMGEIAKLKRAFDGVEARVHEHGDLVRQVSRDLHNCQEELKDCQDDLVASECEREKLRAKVLLLKGFADRAQSGGVLKNVFTQSGGALKNALAQSQDQRKPDGDKVGAASPKPETVGSNQTVIKHEAPMSELDAFYIQYRNEYCTPRRRKSVEELDRKLAEEAQTVIYQFPGPGHSLEINRPVTRQGNRIFRVPSSTDSQLSAPLNCEGLDKIEEADRQLAEKLQAEEYQVVASDRKGTYTPFGSPDTRITLPKPIPYPIVSEDLTYALPSPRPSPSTSFRAPLGDNFFYYHYDEWLAKKKNEDGKDSKDGKVQAVLRDNSAIKAEEPTEITTIDKGKKKAVENCVTPTPYDDMTDKQFWRLQEAELRAAAVADAEQGHHDDPNLHYYLTDEELMDSGSYSHEEVEESTSQSESADESTHAKRESSLREGDEQRISRMLDAANRLPFAGFEYVE